MNRCLSIIITGTDFTHYIHFFFIAVMVGKCAKYIVVIPYVHAYLIHLLFFDWRTHTHTYAQHISICQWNMKRQLYKVSLSSFSFCFFFVVDVVIKRYIQSIHWTPVWFLLLFASNLTTFPFFWLLFVLRLPIKTFKNYKFILLIRFDVWTMPFDGMTLTYYNINIFNFFSSSSSIQRGKDEDWRYMRMFFTFGLYLFLQAEITATIITEKKRSKSKNLSPTILLDETILMNWC